jgi:hypothetical protein
VSSNTGRVTGRLTANRWTKVIWTWGIVISGGFPLRPMSLIYSVSVSRPGGQYRCYTIPVPVPYSSGGLPARVTMSVIVYGDMWLFCPEDASYEVIPVGREPLTGWPANP